MYNPNGLVLAHLVVEYPQGSQVFRLLAGMYLAE